jgi:hypothetical protein
MDEVFDRAERLVAEAAAAGEEDPDPEDFVEMPDHLTLSADAKERALQDFARMLRLQVLEQEDAKTEEELKTILIDHGVPLSLHHALVDMVNVGRTDSSGHMDMKNTDTWVEVRKRVRQERMNRRKEIEPYERQLVVLASVASAGAGAGSDSVSTNGLGTGADADAGAGGESAADEIVFPATLNKDQRAALHALADDLGLGHGSRQIGGTRQLVAWRMEEWTGSENSGDEMEEDGEDGDGGDGDGDDDELPSYFQ